MTEKEVIAALEALAIGFDPKTGAELPEDSRFTRLEIVRQLFILLRLLDEREPLSTKPPGEESSADVYLTAMDAARAICGVECESTANRFQTPNSLTGWFPAADMPQVSCRHCGADLHGFRSLYYARATPPRPQYYWALVCRRCAKVFSPKALSAAERKKLSKKRHQGPFSASGYPHGVPRRRHAWALPPLETRERNLREGKPYRHWGKWSSEEKEDLCDVFKDGYTTMEIAEYFQRTKNSIFLTLRNLGLIEKDSP